MRLLVFIPCTHARVHTHARAHTHTASLHPLFCLFSAPTAASLLSLSFSTHGMSPPISQICVSVYEHVSCAFVRFPHRSYVWSLKRHSQKGLMPFFPLLRSLSLHVHMCVLCAPVLLRSRYTTSCRGERTRTTDENDNEGSGEWMKGGDDANQRTPAPKE